jgi:hypothetical protein
MVVFKKDDTMSSMSNTRKDIAERLGSAQPNNRPGVKAKMATPAEFEQQKLMLKKGIASINKNILAAEANLRDELKRANWSNVIGYCQSLSSLYLRLKEMYSQLNSLAQSME